MQLEMFERQHECYWATYPDRQHHPNHTAFGAIYRCLREHGSHGGHFEHLLWHGWDSGHVLCASLVAQAVRHSPPTAGVPSSHLGHSMWVLWWTKWGLGRFFTGFLPFSPTTNFISPFLHTHLIHFVSFHQPLWWCIRHGRPAPLPFIDLQYRGFITSHPSTRPCVGHELRIFIYFIFIVCQGSLFDVVLQCHPLWKLCISGHKVIWTFMLHFQSGITPLKFVGGLKNHSV